MNTLTPKLPLLPSDQDEQLLPCANKIAFDTLRQAEIAAIVAAHQHGASLSVYRCQYCQLWHLSSGAGGD